MAKAWFICSSIRDRIWSDDHIATLNVFSMQRSEELLLALVHYFSSLIARQNIRQTSLVRDAIVRVGLHPTSIL